MTDLCILVFTRALRLLFPFPYLILSPPWSSSAESLSSAEIIFFWKQISDICHDLSPQILGHVGGRAAPTGRFRRLAVLTALLSRRERDHPEGPESAALPPGVPAAPCGAEGAGGHPDLPADLRGRPRGPPRRLPSRWVARLLGHAGASAL